MNISYVTLGSNKLEESVPFYTELFAPQGITKLFDHPRGGVVFGKDGKLFLCLLTPFDKEAACVGNGSMVAFGMDTTEEVDAFYAKARELGATCEGEPGQRGPGFYMAYLRDLDGNKICACKLG